MRTTRAVSVFVGCVSLTAFAAPKKSSFKGGLFNYLTCQQELKHGFTEQATINLIVDAKKKVTGIQGIISRQVMGEADFIHGFSTLTAKVSGVSGQTGPSTVFIFSIKDGKSTDNADGQVFPAKNLTELSFEKTSTGNTLVVKVDGKEEKVTNCLEANASLVNF